MDEVWERYFGNEQKEVLTSEKLRQELSDERREVLGGTIGLLAFLAFMVGLLVVMGIWLNIPALIVGLFVGFNASYLALELIVYAVVFSCFVYCGIRYFIRLHKARENGMKISIATVSSMRRADVYIEHARGSYANRDVTYYYLTFKIYGEVRLRDFDYEFTNHPMTDGDIYYSTSVGDKFYLISFKNNGDIIKVFPTKYFDLSEELKAWLK